MRKLSGVFSKFPPVYLGLHLPTEQTSGHILQTAAACGLQLQVGKQSVEMLGSMKKMLKSKVKKLKAQDGAGQLQKIEHVVKYPSEPSASMIESLYDQDDKPEKLDGQVCQSLEALPLKKSSKLYDRGSGREPLRIRVICSWRRCRSNVRRLTANGEHATTDDGDVPDVPNVPAKAAHGEAGARKWQQ